MQMTWKTAYFLIPLLGACTQVDRVLAAAPNPLAVQGEVRTRPSTPVVDHHTHLISPLIADVVNGPPLERIRVPDGIADLLARRAQLWNDAKALEELYDADALVLVQWEAKSGLFQGKTVAAAFLTDRFAREYQLTPAAFTRSGDLAHVAGYYTRGETPNVSRIGYFHLLLKMGSDGRWRISSEAPTFPSEQPQGAVVAEQLIAALDAAGIQKAVVLSGAAAIGGRWLDIYHDTSTAAERHAMVRAENDWTVTQASLFGSRLLSFCSLNPLEPYALEELRRCARTGHRGLKLHFDESGVDLTQPEHIARARAVFALTNEMRLPVVVHVGNNEGSADEAARRAMVFLERIATAAPDVTIQIAHLWGGSDYSEGALRAYANAVSSNHPATRHLWFDMAEAPLIAEQTGDQRDAILADVAARIRQIGVARVLFGSDTSGKGHLSPSEAWAQFQKNVPLRQEEFAAIAGNVAPYVR